MSERLLRPSEAAERLGIKRSTFYNWCYRRCLPTVKIGNTLRIRESVLDAFIRKRERPALR
jgi:excisionase family DNA binding protein